MADKLKKIREEVERLYNQSLADENRQADRGLERAASVSYGKSKACKELLSFIDSLQKEPVSEDLEEAANEYAKDYLFTQKPQRAPNIHFINGANWQKQQVMVKAVDATIAIPYQNGYGGYTQLVDSKEGLPFGEKLKVLVIKEDLI